MGSKSQCNISSLIMDNKDFLNLLARSKSDSKRHRMLKQANSQQLLAIAEICLNIVKARYQLTTRQRKRLLPYAEFVRRMSRARRERSKKNYFTKGKWDRRCPYSSSYPYTYRNWKKNYKK